jgi:hypothetical protein
MSHHFSIEWQRHLFRSWSVVCQVAEYVMSHLNNCGKEKDFRFSDMRYWRWSDMKEILVLLIVSIDIHQQNDKSWKNMWKYCVESNLYLYGVQYSVLPVISGGNWQVVLSIQTINCPHFSSLQGASGVGINQFFIRVIILYCCCGHVYLPGWLVTLASTLLGRVEMGLVMSCHLPHPFHQKFPHLPHICC